MRSQFSIFRHLFQIIKNKIKNPIKAKAQECKPKNEEDYLEKKKKNKTLLAKVEEK